MLRRGTVHDRTRARFHLPRALAGRDHDGGAAEAHHRALERREGTQRRVQEQQPEHLACERLRLRMLLQPCREAEQVAHLFAREVGQIEKTLHRITR
jgi:hypothetical protein